MSKRVGTCLRCGHCCRAVFLSFGMGDNPTESEQAAAKDFLRWAEAHKGVTVKWVDETTAEVGYDSPCEFLEYDDHHRSVCKNYENRPEICRRYPEVENPNCPGFRFVD